jgi:selenophosphate synthase
MGERADSMFDARTFDTRVDELVRKGRLEEAEADCREILGLQPDNVQALHLGSVLALGDAVTAMKDPTRGGVSSALSEMAEKAGVGVILEEGPPSQLFGDPKEERTRRFIGKIIKH